MIEFDVSIIKYLGQIKEGILCLVTVTFPKDDITFDGTFYYSERETIFTVLEEIEEQVGDIRKTPIYEDLIKKCLNKVSPLEELYPLMEPLDVKPYLRTLFPNDKRFQ